MAIGETGYNSTRMLGTKRVVVSNSPPVTPLKRMRSGSISLNSERFSSPLEALPSDVLVQVLCGVDHEDLKQLCSVSKTVREATLTAKELHFGYRTPKKKTFTFQKEDANRFRETEAPGALLRKSKSRLNRKKLDDITMALFASMDEEHTTRRNN